MNYVSEDLSRSVFAGSFDSEIYWRDEALAKLPAMNDEQANNIVLAMDELLFVFCKPGDALITRFGMHEAHKSYLERIGFEFINNRRDVIPRENKDKALKGKSIMELLHNSENKDTFKGLLPENALLSPFAVIPFSGEVAEDYGLLFKAPSMEIIKHVNSKIYSTKLKELLGIENISIIVSSAEELLARGTELLKASAFIIKDESGVSGKGNLLVSSETSMRSIVAYLAGQEKKGKDVRFILEPFLEKETDFSCQFYISETGNYQLLATQKLVNNGFAYQGTFSADEESLAYLSKNRYFEIMEGIAEQLYKDGYHGHVCIDSMLLQNGEVTPLVELNARKSMSLIKYYVDKYLKSRSLQGSLTYVSLTYNNRTTFEQLMEAMEKAGLLYLPEGRSGVIPLTANTLFINRDADNAGDTQKTYKGRLYFAAAGETYEGIMEIIQKMRVFMEDAGFKIQN